MTEETATRLEEALETSNEQLQSELLEILGELDGEERAFARAHPELVGRLIGQLSEVDVASFVSENPETADQFQDLMWTGMEELVAQNPDLQSSIDLNATVNFEADDCPMEGHLEVDGDENQITGGAGTLAESTIEITGPGDNLVGLLTGDVDPVQGFMSQQYSLNGPVMQGTRLAPIMNNLAETIP